MKSIRTPGLAALTQTSVNATLAGTVSHLQEHLGKAITDTRAAGVVPPWSEG